MKNSVIRHPIIRCILRFLYCILFIVIVPILLVFYLPCAATYRGGEIVNECLMSWEENKEIGDRDNYMDGANADDL